MPPLQAKRPWPVFRTTFIYVVTPLPEVQRHHHQHREDAKETSILLALSLDGSASNSPHPILRHSMGRLQQNSEKAVAKGARFCGAYSGRPEKIWSCFGFSRSIHVGVNLKTSSTHRIVRWLNAPSQILVLQSSWEKNSSVEPLSPRGIPEPQQRGCYSSQRSAPNSVREAFTTELSRHGIGVSTSNIVTSSIVS